MKFFIEIDLNDNEASASRGLQRILEELAYDIGHNGYGVPGENGVVRNHSGSLIGKWGVNNA